STGAGAPGPGRFSLCVLPTTARGRVMPCTKGARATRERTKPVPSTEYLDVPTAAAVLGVGCRSVYRLIEKRALKAVEVNERGDLRIRRRWLDEYAERASEASPADRLTTEC